MTTKLDRCGHCNRRAAVKTYRNIVGPDGLYTEERCTKCGGVLSFTLQLAVEARMAAQLIAKGAAEPWSHPGRML